MEYSYEYFYSDTPVALILQSCSNNFDTWYSNVKRERLVEEFYEVLYVWNNQNISKSEILIKQYVQ